MSALRGRRIVVTRPDAQAAELCAALEAAGAVAVRCPTIRIAPPESWAALDAALAKLDSYDWVIFTSANGVGAVLARLEAAGLPATRLGDARVAAGGRMTARALVERGIDVAFVPEIEGAGALAETMEAVAGCAFLVAQGDRADPHLAETLRRRGARRVDSIPVYRTVPMAPAGAALDGLREGVDAVTFTSPSTVAGFLLLGAEWRPILKHAMVATIGPTTTAAALASGLGVHAEARERSTEGLMEALVSAFTTRPVGSRLELGE